jgi:hypothetical protein
MGFCSIAGEKYIEDCGSEAPVDNMVWHCRQANDDTDLSNTVQTAGPSWTEDTMGDGRMDTGRCFLKHMVRVHSYVVHVYYNRQSSAPAAVGRTSDGLQGVGGPP